MNGSMVYRHENTIFIPLPREQWRSCGECQCPHCNGKEGYWDTLAVSSKVRKGHNDYAWTVHMPGIHRYAV